MTCLTSRDALKNLILLYNTNHLRFSPGRMKERRKEIHINAENLTEADFNRLSSNQREWLVGETVSYPDS